jgi:RNA polymerase sigma factor (TIGR02999 family)
MNRVAFSAKLRRMPPDITQLLMRIAHGDSRARDELLPLVYEDLKRRARSFSAREGEALTLGTTGLLHEGYLRLVGEQTGRFENRRHFFAAAAEAMRRILIERARSLARIKRGSGAQRIALDENIATQAATPEEVLALDQMLAQLEARDEEMAIVVKLRYFGGMSVNETADALAISPRSVDRAWAAARAWLRLRLDEAGLPS